MSIATDFEFRHRPGPPNPNPNLALLGPLLRFLGGHAHMKTWRGRGFNLIWRPNFNGQSGPNNHFLELNCTTEELSFTNITGTGVANRAINQNDIFLGALSYLQQISDIETGPIHFEPGVWANIPATQDPNLPETITRMGSIPHGVTVNAQGVSILAPQPVFNTLITSIVPFNENAIDDGQHGLVPHQANIDPINVANPSRTPLAQVPCLDQQSFQDPSQFLIRAVAGQNIRNTQVYIITTQPPISLPNGIPNIGGGTANIEFLLVPPNANAARMTAVFWVETVVRPNGTTFEQLQYFQRVLLNFAGLSWPHISVATLT